MATVGTAEVEVEISKAKVRREADAAGREIEQSLGTSAKKAQQELESTLGNIRIGAGLGVAAGVGLGLGAATKAASDLNETTSKSAAVFGEAQGAVLEYAESAAQGIGLSKRAALDATSTFGNLFTQLGVGQEEAANLSTEMVTLAADFGSFFNEDPTRIIEAQTAAFRGEYDALQKYVPTINAAAVEQKALTETGKANADQLTQQEKALATYSLMMEGAGAAQGDFARTSDSAANAAKRAKAEVDNSAASLGQALLPVAAAAAEVVGALAGAFGELPGPVQTGIVGVGGLTLATGLLLPKLVEGAQLMKLAGTKAIDFATGTGEAAGSTSKLGRALGTAGLVGALAGATYGLNEYRKEMNRVKIDSEGVLAATDREIAEEITKASKAGILGQAEFEATGKQNIEVLYAMRDALKANGDEAIPELEAAIKSVEAGMERADTRTEKYADTQTDLADETDKATDAMREQVDAARAAFDSQRAVTSAEEDYVGAVQAVDEARRGVADAEQQVDEAYRGVADAQRAVADAQDAVADAVDAVADARRGVADAERAVVDAQEAAAQAADDVTTATEELTQARMDARWEAEAIQDAYSGVIDAEEGLRRAQEDSLTAQQALDDARSGYSDTMARLSSNAAGAVDDVTLAEIRLRDAQENLATLGDDAVERVAEAQRRLAELGPTATASQIAAAMKALKDAQAALPDADDRTAAQIAINDAQRALDAARERAAAAAENYQRNLDAGVEGSDEVVAAHEAVEGATDNETAAQERLEDAVLNVASVQEAANQRVADAQDNLTAAIGRRADADQAVVDAKQGVVDAHDNVRDAARGVQDAQQRVRDATNGVADANQRVVDAKQGVVDAQGAVEKAIIGVRDRTLELALAQFEVDQKTGDAKTAIDEQIGRLGALRDTLDPGNPLRRQLDDYIAALERTKGFFTATIAVNFTDAAGAVIDNAQAVIDAAIPRRAKGGPVSAGQPYIVGEERAEVFWPDSAGTIIPSTAGFGTGGGSKSYSFSPTYVGITDAEEASALANAEWSWRMQLEPA